MPGRLSTEESLALFQARLDANDTSALASQIANLERDFKAALPNDKELTAAIKSIQKQVAAVEKTVSAHLSPSKKLPGFTVESAKVIEVVADAVGRGAKADEKRVDAAFAAVRTEFTAIATQMAATAKRLETLADAQTILAADKLQKAARFFSTSPVGTSAGGAKGYGIVENTILKGVVK